MTGAGHPAWVPFYVVGLWLFVGAILAEASRWTLLARRFPGGPRPEGPVLRGQVIGVGIVGEKNVTGLIPTSSGLYLYVNFLFRFRRPPLLVPWSAVKYESTRRSLWMKSHLFDLGNGITTIRVRDKALLAFKPFLTDLNADVALT